MTKHEFGVVLYTTGNGNLIDMCFSLSGMPDEAHPADYEEAVIDLLRDATPASGHSIYHSPVNSALKAWVALEKDTVPEKMVLTSGLMSDEVFPRLVVAFPQDVLKHVRAGNPEADGAFQHLVWQYREDVLVQVLFFSKFVD